MRTTPEGDDGLHLRYCIFDWDDNVVYMPTRIWLEDVRDGTAVPVSTTDYAKRRHDPNLRHPADAFREFDDDTGDFQGHLQEAMEGTNWQGPAFQDFKSALMDGRIFAIVTARSHGEATMREAMHDLIFKVLSLDERETMLENLRHFNVVASEEVDDVDLVRNYLDACRFIGVSNPTFRERSGTASQEEGKKFAIKEFVKFVVDMTDRVFRQRDMKIATISFGMSDDDQKNVQVVDELMRSELSPLYTNVKFVAFDTGGGDIKRLKSHLFDADKLN